MKINVRELRRIIRYTIREAGGGTPTKPRHMVRNDVDVAPTIDSREQLGNIVDDDNEDVSPHLRDAMIEPEDDFGPVPPTDNDPYVTQDPLVRDYSPLPTPGIRR
jgi:hypothetical protein